MNCGLVVPVYNEEKRFSETYFKALLEYPSLKLLFVNDGSSDTTLEILTIFTSLNNRAELINLPNNQGKSEAVRVGMLHLSHQSNLAFVGFIDADGAIGVADVAIALDLIVILPPHLYFTV